MKAVPHCLKNFSLFQGKKSTLQFTLQNVMMGAKRFNISDVWSCLCWFGIAVAIFHLVFNIPDLDMLFINIFSSKPVSLKKIKNHLFWANFT